ncbi:DUF2244 domain-containing protein [Marinobacter sp. X15-166B]|uniref:DUF2244 domain-containing protein n=1 Tax=Marinobacter sp. X15-166B TaxID=1897620 RepID=UPI00085CAC02|nr:DUF2244 domain-containing protein [Marinobacter sp. X15-166B]OEY65387.1 hypothetical protein BG841_02220 [Marinobacter sp. X15-166B]
MVRHVRLKHGSRLLLTPNRSLSWRGNVRVWLALSSLSLGIAVAAAWAGAWVVLPFAGLELAALGYAIYYTAQQCQLQEVLDISTETLHLEKGRRYKQMEWDLPRQHTRVTLIEPPPPSVTRPRLVLIYRDLEISLASFLNSDDTRHLLATLRRLGIRIHVERPTSAFWF